MKHIMLELDTLSLEPNALITSIGAVEINFEDCTISRTFERNIHINSYGSTSIFDISPIMLYNKLHETVNYAILNTYTDYKSAITGFLGWCENIVGRDSLDNLMVWGNGVTSNNSIMRRALEIVVPNCNPGLWALSSDRCFRSVKCVLPEIHIEFPDYTPGRALHSAKYQSLYLLELYKQGYLAKYEY